MVLQDRKSSPQKSRPPESGHMRHGVWIAIEYSYKLDQKKEFNSCAYLAGFRRSSHICWQGKYYIDTCLPFGLRSAPYIFNRLATAIHWILQNNYNVQFILHYVFR